ADSAFGAKKGEDFAIADEGAFKRAGDQFEGYTTTRTAGVPIVAMFDERRRAVDSLSPGTTGYIALAKTPFYLESGGQVSDSGRIFSEASGGSATVDSLSK